MKKTIFFAIMIFILIPPLSAEEDDSDSTLFKKYKKMLTIRTAVNRPSLDLAIRPVKAGLTLREGQIVRYTPNTLLNLNVGLSWYGFGASLNRKMVRSEVDTDTFGKTEYRDYQIYYHSRRYGVDFYWQEYSGFYLLFPQRFGYERGDPETRRSDISIRTLGINFFYSFLKDFSFSAAFDQSERQMESGWTILLMLSFTQFSVQSDRSLIPPSEEIYYGDEAGYRGGDYRSAGISPGAGYTLILWRYWYITAAVFLGGGWMQKQYTRDLGTVERNEPFGRFNARISLGMNTDHYFFGALGIYDTTSADRWWRRDEDKIVVRADVIFVEIYGGIRLEIL